MDSFDKFVPNFSQKLLPWLTQNNFPVVSLTLLNNNTLVLQQTAISKFLPNKTQKWWIPLNIATNSQQKFVEFENETVHITLPQNESIKWIEANYNYSVYLVLKIFDLSYVFD